VLTGSLQSSNEKKTKGYFLTTILESKARFGGVGPGMLNVC